MRKPPSDGNVRRATPGPTRALDTDPTRRDVSRAPPLDPLADAVLDVWFADPESGHRDRPRSRRWFRAGKALDRELERRFAPTIAAAARGEHDAWRESPAGALALIVLLDQFPRHVHRGTPEAFAHDARALAIAEAGVARGDLDALPLVQGVFYCLPFEHAESRVAARRSLALFRAIAERAPPELERFARATLDSAAEHAAIVERFGRYSHRNAVLGRASTAEERAWLAENPRRFGQG